MATAYSPSWKNIIIPGVSLSLVKKLNAGCGYWEGLLQGFKDYKNPMIKSHVEDMRTSEQESSMRFKIVSLIAVAGLVAACGTAPTSGTATTTGGGAVATGAAAGSQLDLVVNVGDRVHFAYDKYNLTPESRATLQKQAAWLKANSGTNIMIEGHCDERGTREYNLALGMRRANAAYDYMLTLGVAAGRMATTTYGKERPQAAGSDELSWAANRRAVSVVR